MHTIVISAVNLVEAGTLAILKDCLAYLSQLAATGTVRVVAIVYKRSLAAYEHIEYIETQWPKKRWVNRLWYEYVTMKKISRQLAPVHLWLSLHDTSPSVHAHIRAVYCHNAYMFYKWKISDFYFTPKIALFAMLTKYIYRTNIYKNKYLVVQQNWFRQAMARAYNIPTDSIIVAPPQRSTALPQPATPALQSSGIYSFVFAASANSHKNFEVICRAAEILERNRGLNNFKVTITVGGTENAYARWLYKKWGSLTTLNFSGFMPKNKLFECYNSSNCLIFPSKTESWGLPIQEFAALNKPLLLANLPYAHETAAGAAQAAFFNTDDAAQLAELMLALINGNTQVLHAVPPVHIAEPAAYTWQKLFSLLLSNNNSN